VSEYQYYEFVALDRPLTTAEQAEVRELSTRATITATSFRAAWASAGSRSSGRAVSSSSSCVDPQVSVYATSDHVILDMTSEDEPGDEDEDEDLEGSLSGIIGTRAELAAGDLRPLYLAWLSGYGTWERDEDAFDDEDEDVVEPPVPPGLGSLTASQRALADFLRVDADLLDVAAKTSPALPQAKQDPRGLTEHIAVLPASEKDRLLGLVATGHATRARAELLRGFAGQAHERRRAVGRRRRRRVRPEAAGHQRAEHPGRISAGLGLRRSSRSRRRVPQ
jgi:hypothetical protein